MTAPSILLLAVGLAMDATAVAAAKGCAAPRFLPRHAVLVALYFGGFQALMPILGWALGAGVGSAVRRFDHWIAFTLLAAIGAKMLFDARRPAELEPPELRSDPFGPRTLFALAIATSIDALAVGFTLPLLDAPFAATIATIGVVTALLSVCGLWAGRRFGQAWGGRLDLVGGVVLIGLGGKILVEHLGA